MDFMITCWRTLSS